MIELAWIGPASCIVVVDGKRLRGVTIAPRPYNGRPAPYYRGQPYGWFDSHMAAAAAAIRITTPKECSR